VTPAQTNDPRFLQSVLAALQYQTARADEAERQRDGWHKQAGEWEALYNSANARGDLLKSATEDRKESGQDRSFALALMTKQHEEDKAFIAEQDARIRKLEASRFRWGIGGAAIGATICAAATVPNIFNH
jgi:murein tripeptide amidase MpaA